MSLLLTLNIFHTCSGASIVNFEQVNASWEDPLPSPYLGTNENAEVAEGLPIIHSVGQI